MIQKDTTFSIDCILATHFNHLIRFFHINWLKCATKIQTMENVVSFWIMERYGDHHCCNYPWNRQNFPFLFQGIWIKCRYFWWNSQNPHSKWNCHLSRDWMWKIWQKTSTLFFMVICGLKRRGGYNPTKAPPSKVQNFQQGERVFLVKRTDKSLSTTKN